MDKKTREELLKLDRQISALKSYIDDSLATLEKLLVEFVISIQKDLKKIKNERSLKT